MTHSTPHGARLLSRSGNAVTELGYGFENHGQQGFRALNAHAFAPQPNGRFNADAISCAFGVLQPSACGAAYLERQASNSSYRCIRRRERHFYSSGFTSIHRPTQ